MAKKKRPLPSSSSSLPTPIKGVLLLVFSVALLLSLVSFTEGQPSQNWLGLTGYTLAFGFLTLLGLSSYVVPFFLGFLSWTILVKKKPSGLLLKVIYFITLLFSLSVLLSALSVISPHSASFLGKWGISGYFPKSAFYDPLCYRHYLGGVPFYRLYTDFEHYSLTKLLGSIGSTLIFLTTLMLSTFLLLQIPFSGVIGKSKGVGRKLLGLARRLKFKPKRRPLPAPSNNTPFRGERELSFPRLEKARMPVKEKEAPKTEIITPKNTETPKVAPLPGGNLDFYTLPPSTLLTQIKTHDDENHKQDLKKQAEILEETLLSFGIEAKVGDIQSGPTITLFEVHPAIGVKVQKIKALENDIALNLQARSIRIIAPIPGKAAVGIEVPNLHSQEVSFREMLEGYQRRAKNFQVPLLLGKMVNGEDMWSDLTKMPHLIIAGATGSGKSVCINTIAMSIVMNARPDEIKLLLIDPKKVELTAYSRLPHMIAPVITEPHGAKEALNWLVKEMEKRYEIFRKLGIRNVLGFNSRKIDAEFEESLEIDIPKKLPYFVVIIDELADLMMISTSDIETPIARIAQMARAVGIHLILATQRPSREVITGLIKANFPSRLAFKVASRINSQIILDETGAETLLGNGDMLFMPPGTSTLVRSQGAFIRDEDINRVINYISDAAPPNYLIPSFDTYRGASDDLDIEQEPSDPLFQQAKSLVLETGNASTTFIQRKLKMGYARAASLMDTLESQGIIGPQEGAKPRKIYFPQNENNE